MRRTADFRPCTAAGTDGAEDPPHAEDPLHDVFPDLNIEGAFVQGDTITRFALGAIDGVVLSFTDGAALPGGDWLFSAAAEDTSDACNDGRCAGSAIGLVDARGTIRLLERLSLTCKVAGITALAAGETIDLLLVTDADDRRQPALLLSTALHR